MNGTLHRTGANFDGFILQGRRLFSRNWLTECLSHFYELDTSIWRVFFYEESIWRVFFMRTLLMTAVGMWWNIVILTYRWAHCNYFWTFTFHKKSDFVRVILKENFNSTYRPNPSPFWDEKSYLIFSFFFLFFCKICQIHWFLHTAKILRSTYPETPKDGNSNCFELPSDWLSQ